MGGKPKIALALVLGALLALAGAGCGSDASSSSGSGGATVGTGHEESGRPAATGSGGSDSHPGNPSAEFLTPGGDNSIQTYGKEAGAGELHAASRVLEAFMRARGERDWEAACVRLGAEAFEPLERLTAPGSGCVGTLAAVSKKLDPSAWENTMTGPIAALRREGGHAFALYHGTAGTDYFIQMTKEGRNWKVAALEPTAFP